MKRLLAATIATLLSGQSALYAPEAHATVLMKPGKLQGYDYQPTLAPDNPAPGISTPESVLGFEVGQRTATPEQISELVQRWAKESDRMTWTQYATSYEGRPLHLLAISSPKNLQNIDGIKRNVQQMAKPYDLSKKAADKLIADTPAVAWMAYSIHGNESSGADSALALIYNLIASDSAETRNMLDDMVILVDPMMNPDGRARFTKVLEQSRGATPNVDVQSLLHTGVWPSGRTNHYYYDLNRDFYFLQAPETVGRVKLINEWYPQLMIDGHEMGATETYLFGPAREPINRNLPASKKKWGNIFASDQGEAFDKQNWTYYTGEWFENLFPGYSNYAEYRGSVHILYEQARTAEDGVRLYNGNIRSYQQSVHHQLVSSIANLKTLQKHTKAMYKDFVEDRRKVMSEKGPYANKSWVIMPGDNLNRMNRFIELLQAQDIEVKQTTAAVTVKRVTDQLGNSMKSLNVPKGALVINGRQPEARLLNAIMEFNADISDDVLLEEWQRTMRDGSSLMYDNTAWNLSMLYGLNSYEVGQEIEKNITDWQPQGIPEIGINEDAIAWMVNGADDAAPGFAARLMEQGVHVRTAELPGQLGNVSFPRGSVAVLRNDNPNRQDLTQQIMIAAGDVNIQVHSIEKGLGEGDLPDLGGSHYQLLTQPKVAIIAGDGINSYQFGATWHMMDMQLGIRHSHIDEVNLGRVDLRSYNVIVLPGKFDGYSDGQLSELRSWVEQGGTLIASDLAARQLAAKKGSKVKLLKDTLKDAEKYDLSLQREWLAAQNYIPNLTSVRSFDVPETISLPWLESGKLEGWNADQLKTWNQWASNFMPSGAMVAGRTDQKHWLTYGVSGQLPLMVSDDPVLMSDDSSEAVIRVGVLQKNKDAEARKLAWSTIPKGYDMKVRMSGLLWPEAAQRLANSAWLTREEHGNGQIILFAGEPVIRGATRGTMRLLLNSIVYGPGLGAYQAIDL